MKTQFFRVSALVVVVSSLGLRAGYEEETKAQAEVTASSSIPAAAPLESESPKPELESRGDVPLAPAVKFVQAPVAPADLKPSPGLAEVIKLAHAGLGEEVMLSFISSSTQPFNINSDQIVYLNDLGVSTAVITSLIQHDSAPGKVAGQNSVAASLPPSLALTTPASNVYPGTYAPQNFQAPGGPPDSPDSSIDAAPAVAAEAPSAPPDFDSSLSPYGSWIDVGDYGRCWQPTVAVVAPAWRPYCDRGRWLWSDCGWYWYSDYSWGWAPFHYGRWCSAPRVGWFWVPDTCWGPSWVSWRHTSGYCGWAPLPPSARFIAGSGFSHHGIHVGIGFDFGLSASLYTFVPLGHLHDRAFQHYRVSGNQTTILYQNSTVINNYAVNHRGRVINQGIGVDPVAHAAGHAIPTVAVHTGNGVVGGKATRHEQLVSHGSGLAVVQPPRPIQSKPILHASSATQPNPGADPFPVRSLASAARTPLTPPFGQRVMASPQSQPNRTLNVTPQPASKAEMYRVYADPRPAHSSFERPASSPPRSAPAYASPAAPSYPHAQYTSPPNVAARPNAYSEPARSSPVASHPAASHPASSSSPGAGRTKNN